jgi:hypothetical protein
MEPPSVTRFRNSKLAIAAALAVHAAAQGQSSSSELSEASLVPVAISVALPVVLLAGVASIVVTGVEASAEGTV